jgi:hypothetical protein
MSQKAATINRDRALAILSEIARDEGNAAADRIHAVEILAKMLGWNEVLKVELGVADSQRILAQLAYVPPRRMRSAIQALENGESREQSGASH